MITRSLPVDSIRRRARAAYELARVKSGALRAALLVILAGTVTFVSSGHAGLAWLALTAAVWTAIEWRGGPLRRGGHVGAAVGLAALAIPLWAFRTCCRAGDAMMGTGCCNMTGACTMVGVALGLTLAVFLIRTPRAMRVEGGVGMGLALLAVASVRCANLVAGEALGLMGGLAAGAAASSLVAAVVDRLRRPA
jgi:hypothetical protein